MDPSRNGKGKGPRKYSLLDSVDAVFDQNRRERKEKLDNLRAKQSSERAHCQYLKSVLPPRDMADARAVVGQWAKKHDKLGNAGRNLLRQSMNATLNNVTSSSSRSTTLPSRTRRFRSRWDMTERPARLSNSPVDSQTVKSDIIVISDSEDLNEESQIELAIVLSMSESSNTYPVTDANKNLTANLRFPGSSRDANSVGVGDQSSSGPLPGQEAKEKETFRCTILNCGANFSTASGLGAHYAGQSHSPCNPCLLLQDLKPPNQVVAYACPQCGQQFENESECIDHVNKRNHRPFITSVPVCGYMCPQCLTTLADMNTCQEHIETLHHFDITYSFQDDTLCSQPTPVPVSLGFLQDFISECSKVESSLFCIDCSAAVESNQCETHRKSFPTHILSSSESRSPADVFMEYLNSCQCDHCGVVLSSHEGALGDLHTCVEGHVGKLRETKVRNFAEFVRLLGLKFKMQSVGNQSTSAATLNSSQSSLVESMENCSMMSIEIPSTSSDDQDKARDVIVINCPDVCTTKLCKKRRLSSVICLDSPETGCSPKRKKKADKTVVGPLFGRNSENNGFRTVTNAVKTVSLKKKIYPVKDTPLSMNVADPFSIPPPMSRLGLSTINSGGAPTAELLSTMKLVIFLDLDNWPSFFKKLPRCLPDLTFVWAFWGGATYWREPHGFSSFTEQKRKGWFHLHKKSGRTKDAADISLVLQVGTMNALLPKSIPFTILSGDKGFCQVEKDVKDSQRRLVVINPHWTNRQSSEMFYTMIVSVFDS